MSSKLKDRFDKIQELTLGSVNDLNSAGEFQAANQMQALLVQVGGCREALERRHGPLMGIGPTDAPNASAEA